MSEKPHVIVNVAQSLNGMIAGRFGKHVDISCVKDRERVLDLRRNCDGILVGATTVINDNPDLGIGSENSENRPTRIILDGRLSVPTHSRVFDGKTRTIVLTTNRDRKMINCELVLFNGPIITVPEILWRLADLGIHRLLVEGGSRVITQFVSSGSVDEFYLYIGNILIEKDGVPLFSPNQDLKNLIKNTNPLGEGVLCTLDLVKLREGLLNDK